MDMSEGYILFEDNQYCQKAFMLFEEKITDNKIPVKLISEQNLSEDEQLISSIPFVVFIYSDKKISILNLLLYEPIQQ